MKIELQKIKIRELIDGFRNDDEEGVVGYGGLLDIRPKYQREFVYNEKQQVAVIDTIFKGYPLNVMYWVKNQDDTFELLDGQQRTLSICSYYVGEFFYSLGGNLKAFYNLTAEEQCQFLDYELMVYVCTDGTEQERIDWFEVINIAGERLTHQEILNAVYSGQWVTEAKRRFSKTQCVAWKLGKDYMSGNPIRQDYLQTVLRWISGGHIEEYMLRHQHDVNADAEWQYFQMVISWAKALFPKVRKEMKAVDWGTLYNKYKDAPFSATKLEDRVKELMIDDDVTHKSGIYPYLITGDEKYLSIRTFTDKMKREAYERQGGICPDCGNHFELDEMEADHITPWHLGGRTIADNCQMLCRADNRRKGGK